MALPEGTEVVLTGTVFVGVRYPYRKTLDGYMMLNDAELAHCLQCGENFPRFEDAFISHIRRHDRRKRVQALA